MRLLNVILFILLLSKTSLFGQIKNDSIQINQIREDKLYRIEQWEKQIESARERGDLYTEMIVMMDLIYFKINEYGDNTSSYEELRYLEELVKRNPNQRAIRHIEAPLNMFLGCTLRDQSQLEEGLEYMYRAVEAAKKYDQKEFYKDASCHYSELLARLGKRQEALENFRRLEKEAIQNNDSIIRNRVYEILSTFYLNEKKVDSAFIYAKKSIDNFSPANQRAFRNIRIAECYLILNKELDSVIYYAEAGLQLARQALLEKEQMYAHDYLAEAYKLKGNYGKAYHHFERFYELEQEQRSFDDALQIGNVNLEREKEASKLQQKLAEERLSNQRLVIWLVSGGLLLLIVGLYYIFNQLKFIRRQNKIIEQEKLRAEQSERYKEQFLANMSHEIRTPMHAISGMLNALRRQPHPESQNAFLDAMKVSADNLLVILNDVLDMSKIESGNLEIEQVAMNPEEIIIHVVNIFKYKAEEKGLTLNFNVDKDMPQQVVGDPGRFNQVLINLISNAVKFTETGVINVNLLNNNDKLRLEVKDTGTGLSKQETATIFGSFKQGTNVSKGKQGGTGLGLAICKQLIELQDGKIWVESEVGKGSIFYVELPLIVAESVEETTVVYTEAQLKTIGKVLEGIKILIAEDNSFNVMVVQDDLEWYIPKVNLTFVENGKEALEKYNQEKYDVVLMDVQMPELNGYEATKQIRQLEATNQIKRTPIIAMTASLLREQVNKCYAAGMDAYIPKPYKPAELINTLNDALFIAK